MITISDDLDWSQHISEQGKLHTRYLFTPRVAGGVGRLLISCVPVREQKKNNEKGYCFLAGQCASFRVGKMLFL